MDRGTALCFRPLTINQSIIYGFKLALLREMESLISLMIL